MANRAALSITACVLALLGQATVSGQVQASEDYCNKVIGGYNTTVLMVADPGSFTGSAEAKYYIQNLENATEVAPGQSICVNRAYGTIMGQNVTVISSGINAQSSALCTLEVLSCASHIKDFIFQGTSGFSAAVGGVVNPPDCMEVAEPSTVTRLGDVCVTPFANNWECKLASWTEQCGGYPNQCVEPQVTDNFTVAGLYGECNFDSYDQASVDLADEIVNAAKSNSNALSSLQRNAAVAAYEEDYWAAMSNGTQENFGGIYNGLGAPTVYDYTQCAETDGQFFWSGAPWDYNARQIIAYTLSQGLGQDIEASDVIAVSAMEAVGVAAAMARFTAISGNPKIPYTFVRGNSDYVHLPLSTNGAGFWTEITTVPAVDFVNGYAWAIASYSSVVLNLFTSRCMAANGGSAATCTMNGGGVNYSSA